MNPVNPQYIEKKRAFEKNIYFIAKIQESTAVSG